MNDAEDPIKAIKAMKEGTFINKGQT